MTPPRSDALSPPAALAVNAWSGGAPAASSPLASEWEQWAKVWHAEEAHQWAAAKKPPDSYDWTHPDVGWGLLVADNDNFTEAERATGADLPDVLRQLLKIRKGVVIRYRKGAALQFLRRYYADGPAQDLTPLAEAGVDRGKIPKYVMIWGAPSEGETIGCVPWRVQYTLNLEHYVGRIHLQGEQLENYVNALLRDWKDSKIRSDSPLVWAVDHDSADITHLMRQVIAEPFVQNISNDKEIGAAKLRYFSDAHATSKNLVDALTDRSRRPSFILTSSHGMTTPIEDNEKMDALLGLPVDAGGAVLNPGTLLENWQPDGAIWYAHACCSAGSDNVSLFAPLLESGPVMEVLTAVAGLGARVAPLPTALLGAREPARAFIGHVEPTFDWTLRNPKNLEPLTHTLQASMYNGLFCARPEPVGMAFNRYFVQIGPLFSQYFQLQQASLTMDKALRQHARVLALHAQLSALDRQACVILGDPAVALPTIS